MMCKNFQHKSPTFDDLDIFIIINICDQLAKESDYITIARFGVCDQRIYAVCQKFLKEAYDWKYKKLIGILSDEIEMTDEIGRVIQSCLIHSGFQTNNGDFVKYINLLYQQCERDDEVTKIMRQSLISAGFLSP